jgi:pimeloyl-ACP methyl ester carboxylesterase
MRPVLVRVVNEDLTPILPEITQQTLLIWGERDADVPLSAARIMFAKIKNSSLAVIPGAGHYAFVDRPDEFHSAIKEFLGLE